MFKQAFILSILTAVCLVFLSTATTNADTVSDIQARIDAANANRAALEKEIANYQSQLKVIGDQANTLQTTIKSLDVSTNKISSEVKLTENDISKTTYTILDTDLEIQDKQKKIVKGNQVIAEALRRVYEYDTSSIWEIILSDQDLSESWVEIENIILIQAKIKDEVNSTKDIKIRLELAKNELEQKKVELEKYTKELSDRKKVLASTKQEKSNILSQTKNTEANYQKLLKDKLALKEALDQEINQYESQLRLAIDPKSFPPAGKGILAWPLDKIVITQKFGVTADSARLYVSGSHNGVDFGVPTGTPIKAAGNGIIEGVGDTDAVCPGASFGKWVFIRYDNGLASTYGHLSVISAVKGQRVHTGDVVGYSGNTGYSTGPHLHMSVYAGQGVKISSLKSTVCKGTYTIPMADIKAYLDPLIYL